jgi:TetR/AcrR family transcriptional regulator, transcriptional repressor for nem operon
MPPTADANARSGRVAVTPLGLRTRDALLDAGRVVAEQDGLAELSVAAVTEQAGVAKGTFYVHFADRETFVAALRDEFQARIAEQVSRVVADLAPGEQRLLAGLTAYLDACLAERTIEALIRELQDDRSRTSLASPVETNLRAMGWRDAPHAARLIVAMATEVALTEHDTGTKQHGARRWLRRFIEHA